MGIYLKYDTLEGNVTAAGFEKWIELNTFQWGVGRGIGSSDGTSGVRESSAASVSEVSVTKPLDKVSHSLLEAALWGEPKKVEVAFTRNQKGGEVEFLRYELESTMTSGYSISGGGDRPMESLSFNFTKVTMHNAVAKADNTGDAQKTIYDLATRKNA